MEFDIPDSWPPTREELIGKPVVPLFPLPGVVLFPRQLMPLNVFEPRYRQMIEDCLDGPGRIVMGSICDHAGSNENGDPVVDPIAGLGEITHHERLKDGRFLIWLLGLTRVQLVEVDSDRLYRKVRIDPLTENPPQGEYAERLKSAVVRALKERADSEFKLPEGASLGMAVDVLVQQLELPAGKLAAMFSELNTAKRAELALRAHTKKGRN